MNSLIIPLIYLGLLLMCCQVTCGVKKDEAEIKCLGDGWERGHRGCYFFDTTLRTWEDARQRCEVKGGLLASIGSVAELKYFREALRKRIKSADLLAWWTGLRYDESNFNWLWQDGGEFHDRVSPWDEGEPNSEKAGENCGEMNYKGKMNDNDCLVKHASICEKQGISTTLRTTTPISTSTSASDTTKSDSAATNPTTNPTTNSEVSQQTESNATTIATATTKTATTPETSPVITTPTTPASTQSAGPTRPIPTYCEETSSGGVRWSRTDVGNKATVTCTKGTGSATWVCTGIPPSWKGEPNISACASPVVKVVMEQLAVVTINTPMPAKAVAEAAMSLAAVTKDVDFTPSDIVLTSRIIGSLIAKVDLKNSSQEEITNVMESIVKASSNLLSKNKTSTWSRLSVDDQRKSASALLVGVESSAMAIAEAIVEPTVIKSKDENIDLELHVVDPDLLTEPELRYKSDSNSDEFIIPAEILKDMADADTGLTKIVIITYTHISDLLKPTDDIPETDDGLPPMMAEDSEDESVDVAEHRPSVKIVVSNIISVSVHNKTLTRLQVPIIFTMKHTKVYPANAEAACVFWNFSQIGQLGSWSDEGCSVINSNKSHTVCQCNHLTNFAVLMSVQRLKISFAHEISLQLITYVGCIVSTVALFTSWLTFNCLKTMQGERNSIHKNLVFCLFVAELLFLLGIDKTQYTLACSIIAGCLHYIFLCAFMWMLIEGIHIVTMIVTVFDDAKSKLGYYYFFGYGLPALIISISTATNYRGYGTLRYCWLSAERYFVWSFAGPVAVILLVNAIILVYAMSTVCKHAEYVIKEKNTKENIRAWIQGALSLEVVLGLTWVMGYFYINHETIAIAYVFCILNSFQGLFIFFFHCLFNKKVRHEYRRVVSVSKSTQFTNTRSNNGTNGVRNGSLHRKQDTSYELYSPSSTAP